MFDIQTNGAVRINKGDTFIVALFINNGTVYAPVRYKLKTTDTVQFIIYDAVGNVEKTITYTSSDWELTEDGDLTIKLSTSDTEALTLGKHYYAVKLNVVDSTETLCDTIVTKREFIVLD